MAATIFSVCVTISCLNKDIFVTLCFYSWKIKFVHALLVLSSFYTHTHTRMLAHRECVVTLSTSQERKVLCHCLVNDIKADVLVQYALVLTSIAKHIYIFRVSVCQWFLSAFHKSDRCAWLRFQTKAFSRIPTKRTRDEKEIFEMKQKQICVFIFLFSVIFNFYYCIMILYVATEIADSGCVAALASTVLRSAGVKVIAMANTTLMQTDNVDSTPISSILSVNVVFFLLLLLWSYYLVLCCLLLNIYCISLLNVSTLFGLFAPCSCHTCARFLSLLMKSRETERMVFICLLYHTSMHFDYVFFFTISLSPLVACDRSCQIFPGPISKSPLLLPQFPFNTFASTLCHTIRYLQNTQ